MEQVDAHQHYWSIGRKDYGWLTPESGLLYRDYLPAELKPHLSRHGITRTVLVQAAPSVEETLYMLGLYDQERTIAGVVGWLDFESDEFEVEFHRLQKHPGFVGVRPMIQDLPTGWLLDKRVMQRFRFLAEHEFPVDLQLRPRLLPDAVELLRQVPGLHAVIDHLAKPAMHHGGLEPWAGTMSELAAYPGVICKLSGMVAETAGQPWSLAQIEPYARHVLQLFGHERILFGSDWPVCLLSAAYDEVWELAHSLLPASWTAEQREAVFGRNAVHFYRLKERSE